MKKIIATQKLYVDILYKFNSYSWLCHCELTMAITLLVLNRQLF